MLSNSTAFSAEPALPAGLREGPENERPGNSSA